MTTELRRIVYGESEAPMWGTKFTEIEEDATELAHAIARLIMVQSLDQQSRAAPVEAIESEGARRSSSEPMGQFWDDRASQATGTRSYRLAA